MKKTVVLFLLLLGFLSMQAGETYHLGITSIDWKDSLFTQKEDISIELNQIFIDLTLTGDDRKPLEYTEQAPFGRKRPQVKITAFIVSIIPWLEAALLAR